MQGGKKMTVDTNYSAQKTAADQSFSTEWTSADGQDTTAYIGARRAMIDSMAEELIDENMTALLELAK